MPIWPRPNVIFIMGDDVGYGDLGCYGGSNPTPHLDALATQGMRFTHAYAAAPMCTPTRCGLMTGQYPGRQAVGIKEPLLTTERDIGLEPADMPTLASRLKADGYATALVGKWHLGYADPGAPELHGPLQYGFDYFYGIFSYGVGYYSHLDEVDQPDLWDGATISADTGYVTDLFSDRAVDHVKLLPQPFFLCLNYTAPHFPWQAPVPGGTPPPMLYAPTDPAVVAPSTYAVMMQRMDQGIRRVMAALAARGISNDTLVIFTSDNGGTDGLANQGGLRGAKMTLYEGGIRVPAIVRWPRVVTQPCVTSQVAWTLDWMPTILRAARASSGNGYLPDGISLLPRIIPPSFPVSWIPHLRKYIRSRTLYWRTQGQYAMRSGYWKYLADAGSLNGPATNEQLFRLSSDPSESNNLAQDPARQTLLQSMRQGYINWQQSMLPY
jgi:arylsulfatase A-like enzyme